MTYEQIQEAIRSKTLVYWYGNACRVVAYIHKAYHADYVIIKRIMLEKYSKEITIEPAFLCETKGW